LASECHGSDPVTNEVVLPPLLESYIEEGTDTTGILGNITSMYREHGAVNTDISAATLRAAGATALFAEGSARSPAVLETPEV
jgi:hypothetical protein